MKIAVYGRSFGESFYEAFYVLFQKFAQYNAEIIVFQPFYEFIENEVKIKPKTANLFNSENGIVDDVDLMVCIGGDGTFLETVSLIKNKNIPVVGINSGRMGFLAEISKDQINEAFDLIFEGKYYFDYRTMLKMTSKSQLFADNNFALNEFTIHKGETSSMITIHTWFNNEFLNSFWADGLIIATPTGSTAYSLSTGGPIVAPDSHNFIITPISPHNLTVRPIIVPDDGTFTIKVEGRTDRFIASLDYRSATFDTSEEFTVTKSEFLIKIIKLQNHSFFSTLRNKLMWGLDKRTDEKYF